ncbi:hypothetical protein GCM10022631_29850 [Deinococcus rubellus]|uniref:hypothetical protein n=1 Tax=Deinococcus rubellus TaxID=1889240 RepID=UPI0031F008C8
MVLFSQALTYHHLDVDQQGTVIGTDGGRLCEPQVEGLVALHAIGLRRVSLPGHQPILNKQNLNAFQAVKGEVLRTVLEQLLC